MLGLKAARRLAGAAPRRRTVIVPPGDRGAAFDSPGRAGAQFVSTIKILEAQAGKPLAEWSDADVRENFAALASRYDALKDVFESCMDGRRRIGTKPSRRQDVRNALLLFAPPPAAKPRGRKKAVDVDDENLVKAVAIGRRAGDATDKEALRQYLLFLHEKQSKRTVGPAFEKKLVRLQKRLSEARKRIPKLKQTT